MIKNYKPERYNLHKLRITFNYDGYVGHITFERGGNCKGASLLQDAIDFLDECEVSDIEYLIENDCNLEMHTNSDDEAWFSLTLQNENGDKDIWDDIDPDYLLNLVVAVEIVDCVPTKD